MFRPLIFALLILISLSTNAKAYLVGPMPSLAEMTKDADVLVKAKAVETKLAVRSDTEQISGFGLYNTRFEIISTLKGNVTSSFTFEHYGTALNQEVSLIMYLPQYYDFKPGRSYLIFARGKTDSFHPLWSSHTMVMDAGGFLLSDDKPVSGSAKEILWKEWSQMLAGSRDDVIYALDHLSNLSGDSDWPETKQEFRLAEVWKVMQPFLRHSDPQIVRAALDSIGTRGKQHFKADFLQVANTNSDAEVRKRAILHLTDAKSPAIKEAALRWSRDASPIVQHAALLVLKNYRSPEVSKRVHELALSPIREVRIASAIAMGHLKETSMIPVLESFIKDQDGYNWRVIEAAAKSLMKFPLSRVRPVLERYRHEPPMSAAFTYTLARPNPRPYIWDIARVLNTKSRWSVMVSVEDQDALYKNWHLLLEWLNKQPDAELAKPDYIALYQTLERLKWGSSEPEALYKFYLVHNLTERAQTFRLAQEKKSPDMSIFFNRAQQEVTSEKSSR